MCLSILWTLPNSIKKLFDDFFTEFVGEKSFYQIMEATSKEIIRCHVNRKKLSKP